jgi:hypothetical protein
MKTYGGTEVCLQGGMLTRRYAYKEVCAQLHAQLAAFELRDPPASAQHSSVSCPVRGARQSTGSLSFRSSVPVAMDTVPTACPSNAFVSRRESAPCTVRHSLHGPWSCSPHPLHSRLIDGAVIHSFERRSTVHCHNPPPRADSWYSFLLGAQQTLLDLNWPRRKSNPVPSDL